MDPMEEKGPSNVYLQKVGLSFKGFHILMKVILAYVQSHGHQV